MFDMFKSNSDTTTLAKKGYQVKNVLGQGSYATVKSAVLQKNEKDNPKQVAIKIISLDEVPVEFRKKFLRRELEIIKFLEHPNIIRTIEIIELKKKIYIPIELASKGDLLTYIQLVGPLTNEPMKTFFKQMVDGVLYLHQNGFVHRDIKCDNILLDSKNQIKLADFGFARRMSAKDLSKTFCGSAAYAAPEVLQGIPYQGTSSDVWSLGVVLFTMACALMPFRDTSVKILLSDQYAGLRYPSKLKGQIDEQLKDFLPKLLSTNVQKRMSLTDALNHNWLKS